jgi:hypothetical protein
MKLNVDNRVAALLLDRLKDEQPGTELAELRSRIEQAVQPKPGQPLSAAELEAVADTIQRIITEAEALREFDSGTLDKLKSALPKLDLMMQRQQEREDDARMTAGGTAW